MIKAEEKRNVTMVSIDGDTAGIIVELTGIIEGVYAMFKEKYDEEFANETIAMCGKLAFAKDDETKHTIIDMTAEVLNMGESK